MPVAVSRDISPGLRVCAHVHSLTHTYTMQNVLRWSCFVMLQLRKRMLDLLGTFLPLRDMSSPTIRDAGSGTGILRNWCTGRCVLVGKCHLPPSLLPLTLSRFVRGFFESGVLKVCTF
eukprot:RCo014875